MKKIVPAKAKPTTKPVDKKFGFQADSSSSSSSSSDSDSEDGDKKATNKIETIVDDNSDN